MDRMITEWLIRKRAINEEEYELYEYAVKTLRYMVSPYILVIIWCCVLQLSIWKGLLLIIPFSLFRRYTGGYHAKKEWQCIIISSSLILLFIITAERISCGVTLFIIVLVGLNVICIVSPIVSPNKPLSDMEITRFKKKTILIALGVGTIFSVLFICGFSKYAKWIGMGALMTLTLMVPCVGAKVENNKCKH